VLELLGELVGARFPDDDSPRLRAARQDPQVMAEQMRSAYVELLRATSRARPLLIVIEDLHWGDAPSVKILEEALLSLEALPFAVMAFARPDVQDVFPKLWSERNLHQLRLNSLSRRAAELLVTSALPWGADRAKVELIVERAGGNAFYLEELIRAVAEGGVESLPETVLGMVEARLSTLAPSHRRTLRAASVLGDTFWVGGLLALLGEPPGSALLDDVLPGLAARELIVRRAERRFAGEEEYAFRHSLMREGAYAMLADRDRKEGHRIAGDWLERAGEQNDILLAQHFERGERPLQAAEHYRRAAEQAMNGADLAAAIARAQRGLSLASDTATASALNAIVAEASLWSGDYHGGLASALLGLEGAIPGSRGHCHSLATALLTALFLRDHATLARLIPSLLAFEPEPQSAVALASAFHAVIFSQLFVGQSDAVAVTLDRMRYVLADASGADACATGWLDLAEGHWKRYVERDPWGALTYDRKAIRDFDSAGATLSRHFAEIYAGRDLALLGAFSEAEVLFARGLASTAFAIATRQLFEAIRLAQMGRAEEAYRTAESLCRESLGRGDHIMGIGARIVMIDSLLKLGDIEGAAAQANAAGEAASLLPYNGAGLLSCMAEIRLRRGAAEEALRLAEEALAISRRAAVFINPRQEGIALLRAEALHASGDLDGARAAIREARSDLLAQAARVEAPIYQKSFLENVTVNARTIALAERWLEDGATGRGE
jgi:tetratricopeptide (TPR) repeat protein